MATTQRRPLPSPPRPHLVPLDVHDEYMGLPASYPYSAYVSPFPYQAPFSRQPDAGFGEQTSTLRGGTLLHKGFYDLLSLIPSTPSPSRLFWRAQNDEPVAGPRYEEIPPDTVPVATDASLAPQSPSPRSPPPGRNLKGRRISKDMVSKPTNFMYVRRALYCNSRQFKNNTKCRHLVHASDADQAEALLTRWGPEGQGKVAGSASPL
jgi:protein-serine/threonine kinase